MKKKIERNYLEIYSLDDLIESNSPSSEFKIELIDPPNFQLNKFFYKHGRRLTTKRKSTLFYQINGEC